jgi:hypothetical protein
LEAHPSPALPLPDVKEIAEEEWRNIMSLCGLNGVVLDVEYDAASFHFLRGALAMTSRTMFLIKGKFVSGALSRFTGSIVIRVNPDVPNGWFVDDGNCNIGYHYDLRSVIRHELLHGIGVSSSIGPGGIGYMVGKTCYPTMFDTLIEDAHGQSVVQGCALQTGIQGDMFVDGIKLFNPIPFLEFSSLSHYDKRGVMWYRIPHSTCLDYDLDALSMVNAIGGNCALQGLLEEEHAVSSAKTRMPFFTIYIFLMLIICRIVHSRT